MTTTVKVHVSKEAIEFAMPRDSSHCMIAEGIKSAVPRATHISVDLQTIRFTKSSKRYIYLTPRTCQIAILSFDSGNKPDPWSFQLRNPQIIFAGSRQAKAAIDRIIKGGDEPESKKESKETKEKKSKAVLQARLTRKRLAAPLSRGTVPDVTGGKSPPKHVLDDGVPFSRRRAFGLRLLEF
jgi:hypothetical protein